MFQRIVVPLDGSHRAERAVPVAARIARSTGGSIVLLRVVSTPIELAWATMESTERTQHAIDVESACAKDYLMAVSRSDELAGIEIKQEVFSGEPALTITAVARSHHAELIVMCSHGETGFQRWVLGSVTQKVTRHSSIPVLVLREDIDFHPGAGRSVRILVGLDGSPSAEAALTPAAQLSTALSAPAHGALHLVRVLPMLHIDANDQNEMIAAARNQEIAAREAYLKEISKRLRTGGIAEVNIPDLIITTSIPTDIDIASVLIEIAEKGEKKEEGRDLDGCDMIAMATHGRGGPGRWVMGSVTERVLGATKLPLLVVRPLKKRARHEGYEETEMQGLVGLL